jgi:hypothetical protein
MGNCCSTKDQGQRLGGTQVTEQPSRQTQMADKDAMLRAAEERLKVFNINQEKEKGGVLAKKLKEQNSIGPGRAVQASTSDATLKGSDIDIVESRLLIYISFLKARQFFIILHVTFHHELQHNRTNRN